MSPLPLVRYVVKNTLVGQGLKNVGLGMIERHDARLDYWYTGYYLIADVAVTKRHQRLDEIRIFFTRTSFKNCF